MLLVAVLSAASPSSVLASGRIPTSEPTEAASGGACSAALDRQPVPSAAPLLRPPAASGEPAGFPATGTAGADYRHTLSSTVFGWPQLAHWCVWIEPASGAPAAGLWEERWQAAVTAALTSWMELLPIELVDDPETAQVRIRRRRPPLEPDATGRRRASHGRATLTLEAVRRRDLSRLEPRVEVLISPAQRQAAIQATALHELGHAFGLWGHSDQSTDAMAAVPGAAPVLELSRRDRATLRWLYSQPTRFGQPLQP